MSRWLFTGAALLSGLSSATSNVIDGEVREGLVPYMPTLVVVNGAVGVFLMLLAEVVLFALGRPVLPADPVQAVGILLAGMIYAVAIGIYFHVITLGDGEGDAPESTTDDAEDDRVDITLVTPMWEFVPIFILLLEVLLFAAGRGLPSLRTGYDSLPPVNAYHLLGVASLVGGAAVLYLLKDYESDESEESFPMWVRQHTADVRTRDLATNPLVLMVGATGLYAVFTLAMNAVAPSMPLEVAYLLTRPGVLLAGLLFLAYSVLTPGDSRVVRDLRSVREHYREPQGMFVLGNEAISFFGLFAYTFALANGLPSLASALTGTQQLFVVTYVVAVLPVLERLGPWEFEQTDSGKEILTWRMVVAILAVVVGAYFIHCGALVPGNCTGV